MRIRIMGEVVGALCVTLLCSGFGDPWLSPDAARASGMSLSEARLIVKNWSMTDFLPDAIVVGDDPKVIVTCRYEDLDPTFKSQGGKYFVDWGRHCPYRLTYPEDKTADARRFMTALYRWKAATPEERHIWHALQYQQAIIAKRLRDAEPNRVFPEEVRRFKVLAETAVNEKHFAAAAKAYELAVILAPWWAEGHFNAALVLAEIQHSAAAVEHMQLYLALNPDATNARAAQDKIYAWGGEPTLPARKTPVPVQLGAQVRSVSPETAKAIHRPDLKGAEVLAVVKESVAEKAGITSNDIVVEYDGAPVLNHEDLLTDLFKTKPGRVVPLKVVRGDRELILDARF